MEGCHKDNAAPSISSYILKDVSLEPKKVLQSSMSILLNALPNIAVSLQARQTRLALRMLQNIHQEPATTEEVDEQQLPCGLFSWSLESQLARLKLPTAVLNILEKQKGLDQLEECKRHIDLSELQRYLKFIIEAYMEGNMAAAWAALRSAKTALSLRGSLRKTLARNTALLKEHEDLSPQPSSISIEEEHFESYNADTEIILMAETRYHLDFLKARVEQARIRTKKEVDELEEQVSHYLRRLKEEDFSTQKAVVCYRRQTSDIRAQLEWYTKKFESDLDEWEERNNRLRATKRQLADKRLELENSVIQHQEEMAELQRLQEEEAARALAEQMEAAEQQRLLAEQRKLKKRKRKSSKSSSSTAKTLKKQ